MTRRRSTGAPEMAFLDTPAGIITPGGIHFRTTRALLRAYAGPVLDVVPLETLVARSLVWLRSGQTVALWTLALLLLALPPLAAAGIALVIYVGWEVLGATLVSRRLVASLRVMEQPLVQAILYVGVLSALGMRGEIGAVGVGLLGFVGMRWGLIPFLLRPLITALRRPLFTLPAPDQLLRAFVLQAALEHNVALPQLEQLKRELRS
jgi:hypothetical protein